MVKKTILANPKYKKALVDAIIRIGLPILILIILFSGIIFAFIIPTFEKTLLEYRKNTIKEMTKSVYDIVEENYQAHLNSEISEEKVKNLTLNALQNIRYGDTNEEYFWINDLDHALVMHPYRPDLIGDNLYNFSDPQGTYLFRNFVDIANENEEGFSEYMWQFHNETNLIVKKISYVKYFEPWGWIIGTGMYIEDINMQIMQLTRNIAFAALVVLIVIFAIATYIIQQWYFVEKERLDTQERLAKTNKKLNDVYNIKTEFVNRVAHDLKSPITPIKIILSGLKNKKINEPLKSKFEIINRNIHNLEVLIKDILTVARLDTPKKIKSKKEIVKFSNFIGQIIEDQTPILKERGFKISTSINTHSSVEIDLGKIQEVINNLIANTIRYSDKKKYISFDVRTKNNMVQCSISDSGPGVTKENIGKIFDNFFIIPETRKTDSTGLGLYICKRIIESHKGKIWAESEGLGKGLTITFTLPIAKGKKKTHKSY